MKKLMGMRYLLCAALLSAIGAGNVAPPASQPAVDPQADALLKKMSDRLAGAKNLRFNVHSLTEELLDSGQKVEFARNSTVSITRPDRMNVTISGDRDDLRIIYDGRQVTIDNLRKKVFGQVPETGPIDEVLDDLAQKHGMIVPLTDLMESDAYKTLSPMIHSGEYLGTGYVFDVKCHHLAFRQESVDWQIWIGPGGTAAAAKDHHYLQGFARSPAIRGVLE